jgi:hypothetical protein
MQSSLRLRRTLADNDRAHVLTVHAARRTFRRVFALVASRGDKRAVPLAAQSVKSDEHFSRRQAQDTGQFFGGFQIKRKLFAANARLQNFRR